MTTYHVIMQVILVVMADRWPPAVDCYDCTTMTYPTLCSDPFNRSLAYSLVPTVSCDGACTKWLHKSGTGSLAAHRRSQYEARGGNCLLLFLETLKWMCCIRDCERQSFCLWTGLVHFNTCRCQINPRCCQICGYFFVNMHVKLLSLEAFFSAQNATNIVHRPGSARTHWWAYSAPQTP